MKPFVPLWSHVTQLYLEWKMFQTKVVEKIKTRTLCPVIFFKSVIYEIKWKNMVDPDRPQMRT